MLYGFGDVTNPLPETVELVEELVTDYVTDLVSAPGFGFLRGRF